jgi:hypothetical protein
VEERTNVNKRVVNKQNLALSKQRKKNSTFISGPLTPQDSNNKKKEEFKIENFY